MNKKISIAAIAVLLTISAIWLAESRNGFFDSKVYAGAMRYWFRDGGMVYDWSRAGTPYGFTYPPFAGLTMAPMAYIPLGAVMAIATLATVVTTALLTWWLITPLVRRHGWGPAWFVLLIATCLALVFEPVRETITFGQVNTLLLTLVAADMLLAVSRGSRWAGIGIGLATAIKLTPGVFILYLLVTRRWRAAFTAMGTATGATLLAAALFPDESREYWTTALWDTGRVGEVVILSNQSLRGMVARLGRDGWLPESAETYVWIALVLLVLAVWLWRVRADDDVRLGLALTGVLGCLISPVTWIHHCVWLLPALIYCLTSGRRWMVAGLTGYALMTSHLAWLWEAPPRPPLGILGSNLYVWFALLFLILPRTPVVDPASTSESETARKQSA